jgi:hypothetical protein
MRSAVHVNTSHRRTLRIGIVSAVTAALVAAGVGSIAIAGITGSASGTGNSTATSGSPVATSTVSGSSTSARFVHPGVFVSKPQLDVVRQNIAAGAEPWKSAYQRMIKSSYASLSRTAKPRATVECGSYSIPNYGCTDERDDALAAYTDALAWYLSRDDRYAKKSVELMNAWARTLRAHTNSNSPLQSGLSGAVWARAGELIRYTSSDWSSSDVGRFTTMMRTVYLPLVANGAPTKNGNWELIETDAAAGIAVFLDDHTTFDRAMATWQRRVPEYLYLKSDGPVPHLPPAMKSSKATDYWYGQTTLVDGVAQETCRDFGHTGWGLDAAAHVAETGRIQGVDLYGADKDRLAKAVEFHATYELGATVPSWLCHGKITKGLAVDLEVAFNALHNRLHLSLPNTERLVASRRPTSTNGFIAWETLTNADNTVAAPAQSPSPSATPSRSPAPSPSASPPSPPGAGVSYEAESASLSGSAQRASCGACSLGGRVHFVGTSPNGWATFHGVNASESGTTSVTIAYANGDLRARRGELRVNGASGLSLSFPGTGSWSRWSTLTVPVTLSAGANTLSIGSSTNYGPNLDRITVVPGGPRTYEAEAKANTLTPVVVKTDCSGCSGGARVASVGLTATLKFNNVSAPLVGWRPLQLYYSNADPVARRVAVSLNGGTGVWLSLPPTGSWGTIRSVTLLVQVKAGNNSVTLSNPTAISAGFDRLTL